MKKALSEVKFEEMKNKTFEVLLVVDKLCEFCDKPMRTEEKALKTFHVTDFSDYNNLFARAKAHDRVEVDAESCKIYLYDHDYPGDAHVECVEKFGSK